MMMWDAQLCLNRLHYYTMENAWASHNSMIGIRAGRLDTPESFEWDPSGSFLETAKAAAITGESRPLDLFSMPQTYGNLLQLFVQRMKLIDDEIGVSSVSYGSNFTTQQDSTLGAQLLRVTGSGRGLKAALDVQDKGIIEPVITGIYRQLRIDKKVTGDAMPKARGAAGIMQKEMQALQVQESMQLLSGAAQQNPDKYGKAFDFVVSKKFKELGIPDDLLPQSPELADEANAALRGLPATPQVRGDGRSALSPA